MAAESGGRGRLALSLAARGAVSLAMHTQLVVVVAVTVAVLAGFVGGGLTVRVLQGVAPNVYEQWTLELLTGSMSVWALLGVWAYASDVRKRIRNGRARVLADTREPDPEGDAAFVETVTRLCRHLDVAVPALRIHPTDAPLCLTVHSDGRPVTVASAGLREALSDDEFEGVLAHETAHLANADHRLMTWAVAPLLAAEELAADADSPSGGLRAVPMKLFTTGLVYWGRLATGLFSRGREYAADAAAARLTGDPAALATALERLDDAQSRAPATDLRDHAGAVGAVNVLPRLERQSAGVTGLLATHPSTEDRIDRLRRLATENA